MSDFTIVTGNQHKLVEFKRLFDGQLTFDHENIDLEEIQSFESRTIVEHKAYQAYALLKRTVLVEDVSAGLDKLNGLPGPFIKFFEQRLGKSALYTLANGKEFAATITCTIGLFDGERMQFFEGVVHGQIIKPRIAEGFGFDICFQPNGSDLTFAEMDPSLKDHFSHRANAVRALRGALGSVEL